MPSFDPIDQFQFDLSAPPPRPTTPPVRRGFLILLAGLSLAAGLVYGIPFMAERAGYAWESGRSAAVAETLAKLDQNDVIGRTSALFRLATSRVAPAVVNIQAVAQANNQRGNFSIGMGSGVVIDREKGFIVTNYHVIKNAERLTIRLSRGGEYPARVVGTDSKTDLAVLQAKAPFPVQAEWGQADKLEPGDWVLAIGSPYMLDQTVTAGIVSYSGRQNLNIIREGGYEDYIQTDAAVNPGNSGGPLVDLRGQVVGINTAIFVPGEENEQRGNVGIGFAISATLARRVVDQLIKTGRVSRGYLGVTLKDVEAADAKRLGLPDPPGAYVAEVDSESPAALAGIQAGDVIVRLEDQPVADVMHLRNRTASLAIGSTVPVTVVRGGESRVVSAKIAELPILRALGLRLKDVAPGTDKARVVIDHVEPRSPAFRSRLFPTLTIVGLGGRPVRSKAECYAAAETLDPDRGFLVSVETPDGQRADIPLGYGIVRRP